VGLRLAGGAAHTAVTLTFKYEKGTATNVTSERGAGSPAGRLPPALGDANEHDADADGHHLLGLRLADGPAHTAVTGVNDTGTSAASYVETERGAGSLHDRSYTCAHVTWRRAALLVVVASTVRLALKGRQGDLESSLHTITYKKARPL
jgi:hypothetical protein